uniref:Uncharacterized protein n=1 Tax=Arundo donax TaxID=35708 RepID=A0A0A8YIY7_ARUDO
MAITIVFAIVSCLGAQHTVIKYHSCITMWFESS